jgi:hypothetical protein
MNRIWRDLNRRSGGDDALVALEISRTERCLLALMKCMYA